MAGTSHNAQVPAIAMSVHRSIAAATLSHTIHVAAVLLFSYLFFWRLRNLCLTLQKDLINKNRNMNTALKERWAPTISEELLNRDYLSLEESSKRIDEIIENHFHPKEQ